MGNKELEMKEYFDHATGPHEKTAGVETQYHIEVGTDAVWLSIEGSVQKEDWKSNFDFAVIPYKRQPELWLAHRGFVRRWKEARDQIVPEVIAALASSHLPLKITGYSHGAALAVLAHEDFGFMKLYPTTVVFGCPKVLWFPSKKIRNRFEKLTLIKRRGDIVTTVPWVIMGYFHPVKQTLIGKFALTWWKRHLQGEYETAIKEQV